MTKSLLFLTAAASIGASNALQCVSYGGGKTCTSKQWSDCIIIDLKIIKQCTSKEEANSDTPCLSQCATGLDTCFNRWKTGSGEDLQAGCSNHKKHCPTGDGYEVLCCDEDNCNTQPTGVKTANGEVSASTILSTTTQLGVAAVGIVTALLM